MDEITKIALQYSSWPVVTLIALFLLKEPLGKLICNLRLFKAGSMEVVFSEQILNQGFTDAQLKIIRSLTASELDLFLLVSFSDAPDFRYQPGLDKELFERAMCRLQEAGLILITEPAKTEGGSLLHVTTSIGKRVRAMLINSTMLLLHADA